MKIVEFLCGKEEPNGPISSNDNDRIMYALYLREKIGGVITTKFTGVILSVHSDATYKSLRKIVMGDKDIKKYIGGPSKCCYDLYEEDIIELGILVSDVFSDEKIIIEML